MKRGIESLLIFLTAINSGAVSQTLVISDDPSYLTGQASSVLDLKSDGKGFLTPRMTLAQRAAISLPAEGLMVYQTDLTKGFYYYDGSIWNTFASGIGSQWLNNGNDIYYNLGKVGIGTSQPSNKLHVSGTDPLRLQGLRLQTTESVNFMAVDTSGIVMKSGLFIAGVSLLVKATYIIDVPNISNNDNLTVQVSIPGAMQGDVVITTPSGPIGTYGCIIIGYSYVSAPGIVSIRYANVSNQSSNPPPMEYYVLLAR